MRDWEFKEWLIVAGFVLAALALFFLVIKSADAAQSINPIGCRKVKYPAVCAASYQKCNDIGLDEACLALAQLDGQLGYDSVNGNQILMSQNIKTGDKPVERVHN
jgi:hypothetical protein